ncbi:MAG: hypothetical protein F6K56_40520 [Moorea sp. SIO3G5]|nr:hypothetical protein [Moorena sp. SIO3G5]
MLTLSAYALRARYANSFQLSVISYQLSAYGLPPRVEACATLLFAQLARSPIGAFESKR